MIWAPESAITSPRASFRRSGDGHSAGEGWRGGDSGTERWSGRAAIAVDPRARAYAQARRHSARVRFYKRAIPIGTAAAVAILVAYTLAGPSRPDGLTLGPISFSGTKVTMESPKMTGFHKDTRPYEVTAPRRPRTCASPM